MKYQYSTQVALSGIKHRLNEEKSISFIYMIYFYFGFGIHSVISLLLINTFANTKIV